MRTRGPGNSGPDKNDHDVPQPKVSHTHIRVPVTRKTVTVMTAATISGLLLLGIYLRQDGTIEDTTAKAVVEKPGYETVLPEGKSITDLGGWKRISPPENDPVFAYSDTLGSVSVNVSQQPLPESFAGSVDDKVAEVAKRFNATTKLAVDGTTAYLGTSSKGPQSVIYTDKNLLIFIKSQKKITNTQWIGYIKQLKIPNESGVPKF